jgi:hypothetical protein
MYVTICGGGNASHVLAALLSSRPNLTVKVYSPFEDEAERWTNLLESDEGKADQGVITAKLRMASSPADLRG